MGGSLTLAHRPCQPVLPLPLSSAAVFSPIDWEEWQHLVLHGPWVDSQADVKGLKQYFSLEGLILLVIFVISH